jgi:hypothetical protein
MSSTAIENLPHLIVDFHMNIPKRVFKVRCLCSRAPVSGGTYPAEITQKKNKKCGKLG